MQQHATLHKRKASDLAGMQRGALEALASDHQLQPSLLLRIGAHTLTGLSQAHSNEDCYLSCPLQWAEGAQGHGDHAAAAAAAAALPPMHLLAIFDGHSSASVSRLCELQLPAVLTQQLLQEAASARGAALDDAAYQRALQGAFEQLDALVTPLDNAGSTATAAIVTADRIHLAWVGDSRAVLLGRGGAVLAATPEHRASREDEQERVVAAGGAVFNNQGALRVMGVLQCTRAIGDKDLQPYGVIPRPEVLSVARTSQAEFLVLATDGLWDVLANEEVYQYAHKTLQKVADRCPRGPSNANGACCGCQAAGVAARALSQCARKQRGSRDDITVLLANMAAACQCLKPPTLLSSSSKGAAAGSLRGTCGGGGSVACDGMPSSSSNAVVAPLHSSPAALDAGATQAQPPWHHPQQPQPPQLPDAVAKQPQQQQQPQHHDQGAADDAASRHPAVRQCVRHDAPPWPAGLQVQPSVAPSSGSSGAHHHAAAAAAARDGGGGGAARGGVLSDLALSSPFAMMLCHDASAKGLDVDDVLHAAVAAAGGAGKSAPPGMIAGALLTAADRVGRSAPPTMPAALSSGDAAAAGIVRKRSLSAALVSSRSCGSVGAQGRMGSSELPVVVLT